MKADTLNRISKILRYVLLGLAALYLGAYVFIALNRIQAPPVRMSSSNENHFQLDHALRAFALSATAPPFVLWEGSPPP